VETPKSRYRPSSRFRAVLFRLSPFFPRCPIGHHQLVLYGLCVGHDTRVVVPVQTSGDAGTFCLNEYASLAYYDERVLAGPEPRPFQLPRPTALSHRRRGRVIGPGFPFYAELAFPRQIEIFLGRQLPDRRVEVLNAGIVGINSFALVDFVPRMLTVSRLGNPVCRHNEFYGPGGVGSSATLSPVLYRAQVYLRRWRLYQWLNETFRAAERRGRWPRHSPGLGNRAGWTGVSRRERYFRKHLERIAQASSEEHSPPLLQRRQQSERPESGAIDLEPPTDRAADRRARCMLKAGEEKTPER